MYSTYYRTPRLYLSGYNPVGQPLPPQDMMEDIVGDYKDKTVTLEDFPFFSNTVKMASVHPCKHASVMKTLLDRADAALRIRREKLALRAAEDDDDDDVVEPTKTPAGLEGLVDEIGKLDVKGAQEAADKDEWEEVHQAEIDDHEVAIRVDQYLVVFLKVRLLLITPKSPSLTDQTAAVHGQRDTWHRTRLHHGRLDGPNERMNEQNTSQGSG